VSVGYDIFVKKQDKNVTKKYSLSVIFFDMHVKLQAGLRHSWCRNPTTQLVS